MSTTTVTLPDGSTRELEIILWEGFMTPCSVEEMRMHVAFYGSCPACGGRKTLIVPNAVYAREKEVARKP